MPLRVAAVLPGLSGRGVLLAAPVDADPVRSALAAGGFAVAEAAGESTGLRAAQAAIAEALRLPGAAGRNLDALVDSLRDLATWWPDEERVALLWAGADRLVAEDLPGFLTLTEILRAATDDLWRGGGPGDRQFETVALVDGHGVAGLRGASA